MKCDSKLYAGIDEVGVSSIAGPMVACVVVLPEDHGINELPVDSKLLKSSTISRIASIIRSKALFCKVFFKGPSEVDEIGWKNARYSLWSKCAKSVLKVYPGIKIILDGGQKISWIKSNHEAIKNADGKYDNVSAAAIVAKATCDEKMREISELYPEYNFAKNKGYPVKEHLLAIKKHGLCPEHRPKMANYALEKEIKDDSINLPLEEIQNVLKSIIDIVWDEPEYVSEWESGFLKGQYVKIVKKGIMPSEKVQYYICKAKKEILARKSRGHQNRDGCSCSAPTHVARPAEIKDWRVWITEGPLKADIASKHLGAVVVGAMNAATWRPVIPVIQELGAKEVVIALDDVETNPEVARAYLTLKMELKRHGLAVSRAVWDEKKGIDDALAAGMEVRVVRV